jgi:hypothetical protein
MPGLNLSQPPLHLVAVFQLACGDGLQEGRSALIAFSETAIETTGRTSLRQVKIAETVNS